MSPVHGDQKLLAQGVRHPGGAEVLLPQGLLHALDVVHIPQPPLGGKAQQMEAPLLGDGKAGVQSLAGVGPALQPLPAQPHHHPLIGLRRVDHGPVDQIVPHQQHVPRLEEIGDALHHIGHLATQQQNQLVKLVIVVVQLLGPAVLQVEQPEILMEISPLPDLTAVQHGSAPFRPRCLFYFSAPFAIPQAISREKHAKSFLGFGQPRQKFFQSVFSSLSLAAGSGIL